MNKTVTYKNDKAVELIKQFKELSKEVATITDQIEKLSEERNKVAIKGQKVKDKLNPIVQKLTKNDTGEFDIVTKVEVSKNDELEVVFTDALEDWKKAYRERKTN
jgi:regulator of replication initiation timing